MTTRKAMHIGVLLTVSAVAAASAGDTTVAEVGDARISRQAFVDRLQELRRSGDGALTLKTFTPAGREEVLNDLIAQQLYAAAAREKHLDADPIVKAALDRAITDILSAAFEQREVNAIETTDASLKAFYDAHLDRFTSLGRIKARHILLKTRSDAERVRLALVGGADFATLAGEQSVDRATAAKGGDIGWVAPGVMVKEVDEALFRLRAGEVSAVIETSFGYHLLRVDEVSGRTVVPFEQVRQEVRDASIADRLTQLKSQLKRQYRVAIHRDVLDTIGR